MTSKGVRQQLCVLWGMKPSAHCSTTGGLQTGEEACSGTVILGSRSSRPYILQWSCVCGSTCHLHFLTSKELRNRVHSQRSGHQSGTLRRCRPLKRSENGALALRLAREYASTLRQLQQVSPDSLLSASLTAQAVRYASRLLSLRENKSSRTGPARKRKCR